MELILKTEDLTKKYLTKTALNKVNLSIGKGKIIGLLGPNGSGKTTFIKIAAGIMKGYKGEILIDGKQPGVYTKSIVSYLPDKNYLYKWMSVKDAVEFFKDFYKDFDEEKAYKLLEFMELDKKLKLKELSKGMYEKLCLSLVLSRKAKLYILDEPIAGVDPVAREKILDAIIESFNKESSMIITTHLVTDIERIFDEVAFLRNGELVLQGDVEDLRMKKNMSIDELFREVFR